MTPLIKPPATTGAPPPGTLRILESTGFGGREQRSEEEEQLLEDALATLVETVPSSPIIFATEAAEPLELADVLPATFAPDPQTKSTPRGLH